jgi:hypothetical protein
MPASILARLVWESRSVTSTVTGVRTTRSGLPQKAARVRALIVVVLTRQNQWDIQELDRWPEGRSRLYVAAEPARSYEMFGDSDAPLEKGGVEKLVCPHSVVVFGATGASGVAYCLTHSAWQHTWISV